MKSFVIRSASGQGTLEFFERTPPDVDRKIERFKVRLVDEELSAVVRVYSDQSASNPADLFVQMAANWTGWQGTLAWDSPEGELSLCCTQDRAGHVAIEVGIRSGPTPAAWTVKATIQAEAGQLEVLAHDAKGFFG